MPTFGSIDMRLSLSTTNKFASDAPALFNPRKRGPRSALHRRSPPPLRASRDGPNDIIPNAAEIGVDADEWPAPNASAVSPSWETAQAAQLAVRAETVPPTVMILCA